MKKNKFSTPILSCLFLAGITFFLLGRSGFSREGRLNVLLITIDTLRADYLSCYGAKKVQTPFIDSLAEEGILFASATAHNVVTLPSHTNILTGSYPVYHGVRDDIGFRLDQRYLTLAEILKKEGYKTAAFVGAFVLDSRFGLDQGFDLYDDFYGATEGLVEFSMVERRGEKVVEPALEWLKLNRESLWFCWVHLFDPHIPYRPPQPYDERYKEDPYAGDVAYADNCLGKLLEYIREKDLARETLIVFTADHGEGLGEHKERTHGIFAYNSTLHVPLIFSQSRLFPEPKVISQRVRHIDILPTILDIVKTDVPRQVQGRSLLPLMRNPKKWKVDDSYFEAMTAYLDSNWAPLQGILSGNFKYIDLPAKELYDVESDPREEKNLAQPENSLAKELDSKLKKILKEYSFGSPEVLKRRGEDWETLKKLETLGYVGGGSIRPKKVFTEEDDPKRLIDLHNSMLDAIDFYYDQGKAEEAATIFQEILKQRPTFSRIYSHLAFIYHQEGRLEEAIKLLEKSLSLGLEDMSVLSKLGVYYQEAERYEESAKILELYLEKYPDEPNAYNYLGVSYWRLGKLDKAVEVFKKLLAMDSANASAHHNLGSVYLSRKDFILAILEFELAINCSPLMAAAYNGLGVAYVSLNKHDEAIKNWQKSVELDERQYDALYNLSILLAKTGMFESALGYIEKFIDNAPAAQYAKDIEKMKELRTKIKARNNAKRK